MEPNYTDTKIDYTSFLRNKPREIDPTKLATMKAAVVQALKVKDVHGHISCTCYMDGHMLVRVNGKYYGVFDTNTGKFFSSFVGD